jgi:hypothetical protein
MKFSTLIRIRIELPKIMRIHVDLNPDLQPWFEIYKLSIHIKQSVHINWRELNFGLKNFSTLVLEMRLPNADRKGTVVRKKIADWDFRKKNDGLKIC